MTMRQGRAQPRGLRGIYAVGLHSSRAIRGQPLQFQDWEESGFLRDAEPPGAG